MHARARRQARRVTRRLPHVGMEGPRGDRPAPARPRVHDLRHSHASALIAAGVPLPVVQRRMGHESIQTTVDVYGHLAPDAYAGAAEAMSVAMGGVSPQIGM